MDAVTQLNTCDPRLARLIAQVHAADAPLAPVEPSGDGLRTLVRAVVGQQLSKTAAEAIFGRLVASCDGQLRAERLLRVAEPELRDLGLSRAKVRCVHGLAEAVADGALDLDALERAPDAEVLAALTDLWGIGRWTAEMYLIFELGRPDVFPAADVGIRRAMRPYYGLEADADAEAYVAQSVAWAPHRSLASRYLWRALDLGLVDPVRGDDPA